MTALYIILAVVAVIMLLLLIRICNYKVCVFKI